MPAGRVFEWFGEAWAYFLIRKEPLEDFFDHFPADEFEGEAWVIEPSTFHETVVAQVAAPALQALHPRPTFLPHLTLAITTRRAPADELRDIVKSLRDEMLGREEATEAIRITSRSPGSGSSSPGPSESESR